MFGRKPSSPPTYHERCEAIRHALASVKSEYQISDAEMMKTLTQIADDLRRASAYAPLPQGELPAGRQAVWRGHPGLERNPPKVRELQPLPAGNIRPRRTLGERIAALVGAKSSEPVDDLVELLRH